MCAAAMAGHTGDGWDHRAFVVFIEAEIFFIDLARHAEHVPCDVLFGFCIAGEIQVMRGAVCGGCVAEVATNAQGGLPLVHDVVEVLIADVLWQDLEISFVRLFVGKGCAGAGGGHPNDHESGECQSYSELFVLQHIRFFWCLNLGKED